MTIYLAKTTFGSFRFAANLAEASAPIRSLPDRGEDEPGDFPTPYQTADARHDPVRAARLCLEYFGRDYWCDPSAVEEDSAGNETFDGMSKDDYLDSLIVSVEAEDDE
jgi:hypothetical protein